MEIHTGEYRASEIDVGEDCTCEVGIGQVQALEALGVGERFPFDQSDPSAGVNRRVEFQALS